MLTTALDAAAEYIRNSTFLQYVTNPFALGPGAMALGVSIGTEIATGVPIEAMAINTAGRLAVGLAAHAIIKKISPPIIESINKRLKK